MGELYGEFNALTQEWTDGLASTMMRLDVFDETPDQRITCFDGPIDAIWIENMNTVLDDNMTLCLANGERIKLKSEMKMLFEVMDLAAASPATVSRIGIVYMDPVNLGWYPSIQTWAATTLVEKALPAPAIAHVLLLFTTYFAKGLKFQRKRLHEPVASVDIQLSRSCAMIITAVLCGGEVPYVTALLLLLLPLLLLRRLPPRPPP